MPEIGYGHPFQGEEALLTNGIAGLLRWPIQVDQAAPSRWRLGPPQRLHEGTLYWVTCDKKGSVIGQATGMGGYAVRPGKGRTFMGPHTDSRGVVISPDGKYAVSGNHRGDEGVKVWDTETGRLLAHFALGGFSPIVPTGGAFSPDSKWLAMGGSRGCRLVKVGTWEEHPLDAWGIFSPDGSFLAVVAGVGVIRLVEPATSRELARLEDPNQGVPGSLAFTADGGKLLVCSEDAKALHVWDLRALRTQLVELGLDWDSPPLPPAPPSWPGPLQIRIDMGNYQQTAQAASLVQHARLLISSKRHSEALAALRKAVQEVPDYPTAHNELAWLLLTGPKELRDPAQALSEARKAVELDSKEPSFVNHLGLALYYTGQFAEAVPVLERSLSESKGLSDAYDLFFLAMCHHRLGDAAQARDCYERGSQWFRKRKGKLRPAWLTELTAFQAEADSVLAQPPGQAKK